MKWLATLHSKWFRDVVVFVTLVAVVMDFSRRHCYGLVQML